MVATIIIIVGTFYQFIKDSPLNMRYTYLTFSFFPTARFGRFPPYSLKISQTSKFLAKKIELTFR